ncbi:MAG: patatin-like phospholipase family protein [Oscillospiraceae bacterium]|nr:patatin-like phospholipase family protein [Oscillospiraceae bacterium]
MTTETTAITTVPKALPTALCLGGGGAKGAFQIGAWQALQEAGLLKEIGAVAGCSAGALNAALFAIGDPELARHIWESIQPSDLLSRGTDGAFFSREGLIRILHEVPLEKVRNAKLRVHVSVQHAETKQAVFFELNGLPDEQIRTLLLASSAMPHVFAPETYLGAEYLDAGSIPEGDLCISPVYHQGHRRILLVTLRPKLSLYGGRSVGNDNLFRQYPDAEITMIKPLKTMGNLLTGTLNFAPEKIRSHMEQGYQDAQAALSGFREEPQTNAEMNALLVQKMQQLFPTGEKLADFIQGFHGRFAPNLKTPTMGGNVWYDNIFEVDGWRLQQQRTAGLKSHYRILDPQNRRAAWVLSPQTLLDALSDYGRAVLPDREGGDL